MVLLVLFQLLGTISVSYGIEESLAAIIVPVSSVNPLVASLLGVIVLSETLNKRRILSIAIIVVSLVIISLEI